MTRIAVIICTFNRCNYLLGLFESLLKQTLPISEFEVIVVDNNSNDDTKIVTEGFLRKGLRLKYIFEPEQGLSKARNRGLRETAAPIVVYIDDDGIAGPDWLRSIVAGFLIDEEVVCAGGPVFLDWQGERPNWLPTQYDSIYTCLDFGSKQHYLSPNKYLVGANVAFRREWLSGINGFSCELGRKGSCLLSGEEARVYQQVFAAGRAALYVPDAKIFHRVPPERKKRPWVFRRLFWDGATQPILDFGVDQKPMIYLRRSCYDIKRCLFFIRELIAAIFEENRGAINEAFINVVNKLGRVSMQMRLAIRNLH